MKKIATVFALTLALTTTATIAKNTEDKPGANIENTLPHSQPAIEAPSPQEAKPTKEQQYSPEQKAAITGLKLTSSIK